MEPVVQPCTWSTGARPRKCSVSRTGKYNIFVPCELQFTCRLQRRDVYLDSGFLSPENAAVRCRHALGARTNVKKVIKRHSVCSVLPVLFCAYKESSLLGILIDLLGTALFLRWYWD